jgi:predicted RNase H-like HicB family nuclease
MTATFRLTLTPDDNGTFLVTSPDLDGFVTYGETEAEAIGQAHDALLTRLEGSMHLGEALPTGCTVPAEASTPIVQLTAREELKVRRWNAFLTGEAGACLRTNEVDRTDPDARAFAALAEAGLRDLDDEGT